MSAFCASRPLGQSAASVKKGSEPISDIFGRLTGDSPKRTYQSVGFQVKPTFCVTQQVEEAHVGRTSDTSMEALHKLCAGSKLVTQIWGK